jgi:hypothetical protein
MKRSYLSICLLTILALTGCKEEVEEVVQSEKPAEAEVEVEQQEEIKEELKYAFPLTGVKTAEESLQRPFAVMINNHPDARPQAGINAADIVYELLVEGDATRYLAIFQSTLPDNIGPVRSARDYFIELAKGYDAIYVAHGYSPEAYEMLNNKVVDSINGMQFDGTYFKRSTTRKAPHNSYITSDNVELAAEKLKYSFINEKKFTLSFYQSEENVKLGNVANEVRIDYFGKSSSYSSIYTYDEKENVYLKSSPQAKTVDDLTNEQVAISNVLFLEAAHQVIDEEGRREIAIEKGGNAYLFQQGVMREVRWKNDNGLIYAIESDGTKVPLVAGKTWVHFVPSSPGLAQLVNYSE